MKTVIENHEALLRQLVLEGDAQAFFSLTKSYLQERYLRERSAGTTAQEASRKVQVEAVELLEQIRNVPSRHLDAWLDEHCTLEAASPEHAEILIDTKIIAETEAFLNSCNRELIRSGSDIKRAALRKGKKFPAILLRNKAVAVPLIVVAGVLLLAAVTLIMIHFRFAVELRVHYSDGSAALHYPPTAWSVTASIPDTMSLWNDTLTQNDSSATLTVHSDTLTEDSLAAQSPSGTSPSTLPKGSTDDTQQRRSLPPVMPKARLKRPPPPPPAPPAVEEPQREVPATIEDQPDPVPQTAVPPSPPPAAPESEATESFY